jgi:hypothetical protein
LRFGCEVLLARIAWTRLAGARPAKLVFKTRQDEDILRDRRTS